MAIDSDLLAEQMKNTRPRNGVWERLVDGQWVPWPVLWLDTWGVRETKRVITKGGGDDQRR